MGFEPMTFCLSGAGLPISPGHPISSGHQTMSDRKLGMSNTKHFVMVTLDFEILLSSVTHSGVYRDTVFLLFFEF